MTTIPIQLPAPISPMISGRVDAKKLDILKNHWSISLAEEVIKAFPDEEIYTCAAGISPSGVVHFGNFRDIFTAYAVAFGLKHLGKKARVLFSWDDFDRFRKVPADMPKSLIEYIGKPLADVPSPVEGFESYARFFEAPLESSMKDLGIDLVWRYQNKEYRSATYSEGIRIALHRRFEIAETLLENMSEKAMEEKGIDREQFKQTYYPITIYSEYDGKDNTEVLEYDGEYKVTYRCKNTGNTSSINLKNSKEVKLAWKIDWPMRWHFERVNFEPGGKDHASPGGSFDSSGVISQIVYGRRPPTFIGYDFIGIQGLSGKMSSSKGGALTPGDLLKVFEPEVLLWLYARKTPQQNFNIAFDSEVFRTYDEFDRECGQYSSPDFSIPQKQALELAHQGKEIKTGRLSFRQVVAFGQIVQWNIEKLLHIAVQSGASESKTTLEQRMERARTWLTDYFPDALITLCNEFQSDYFESLSDEAKVQVSALAEQISDNSLSIEELNTVVYGIPKKPDLTKEELSKRQKDFFKVIYQLLIGRDIGPRLSTFLWATDRSKVLFLLTGEK